MEPFSIACTTCQAKLRVRDASAIGQIVTCPKCGSMVLVEAPAATPISNSSAVETPSGTPRPPPRPTPSNPAKPTSDAHILESAENIALPEVTVKPTESTDDLATGVGSRDTDDVNSAAQTDVSTELQDHSVSSRHFNEAHSGRRWVLGALAGTTGALMAVTLFAVYAIITAKKTETIETANSTQPVSESSSPIAPPTSVPDSESTASEGNETLPSPPASIDAHSTPPNDSANAAATPALPAVEETSKEPIATPQEKTIPPGGGELSSTPPPATAPPEFESTDKSKADRLTGNESLSDTLRKLGGLFDQPDAESEIPAEAKASVAGAVEGGEVPLGDEPTRLVRPPQRTIDVAVRLQDSIPEIEFTNIPLIQFIQFITDFSTIPVTLDPDALMWLDITPSTPVTMKQRDTNVAKLLTDALTILGLGYRVENQQLVVTRRPSNDKGKTISKLNVSDLVGGKPERMSQFRELITAFVAPGTWENGTPNAGSLGVDGTSLIVEHSDEALFDIIALCERLRVARGLPIRGKFNPKHFQLSTRSRRAEPQLAKTVTLNYSRPTSFVKVLQRLSDETDVHLLVDWRAIAEAAWNPEAEITFTVVNQPLSKALDALLKPMELDYRIVDQSTFQIVTPVVLDERQELEIYSVGDRFGAAATDEEILKQALKLISADWFRDAGGRGVMRYDAQSKSLLVLLSQPRQRQFEAEFNKVKEQSAAQ